METQFLLGTKNHGEKALNLGWIAYSFNPDEV